MLSLTPTYDLDILIYRSVAYVAIQPSSLRHAASAIRTSTCTSKSVSFSLTTSANTTYLPRTSTQEMTARLTLTRTAPAWRIAWVKHVNRSTMTWVPSMVAVTPKATTSGKPSVVTAVVAHVMQIPRTRTRTRSEQMPVTRLLVSAHHVSFGTTSMVRLMAGVMRTAETSRVSTAVTAAAVNAIQDQQQRQAPARPRPLHQRQQQRRLSLQVMVRGKGFNE